MKYSEAVRKIINQETEDKFDIISDLMEQIEYYYNNYPERLEENGCYPDSDPLVEEAQWRITEYLSFNDDTVVADRLNLFKRSMYIVDLSGEKDSEGQVCGSIRRNKMNLVFN